MKKFFVFMITFVLISVQLGYGLATDLSHVKNISATNIVSPDSPLQKITPVSGDTNQSFDKAKLENENKELARRGCCSHHGGVCGCDENTGRIRCCDGTLSPSCTCAGY